MVAQTIAGKGPRRIDRHLLVIGTVIVAALIFIAASALNRLGIQTVDTATGNAFSCTVLRVMDGDGPVICAEEDLNGRKCRSACAASRRATGDGECRIAEGCPQMNWEEGRAVLTRIAGGRMDCTSYGAYRDRVDAFCLNPRGRRRQLRAGEDGRRGALAGIRFRGAPGQCMPGPPALRSTKGA
jgi:hypothetical protein